MCGIKRVAERLVDEFKRVLPGQRKTQWDNLALLTATTALAAEPESPERLIVDSTHLMAHRTAASLLEKGLPGVDPQMLGQ